MSNKFTGITSAGSAIPVYDKDAHSALEQKLDTSAFSSVSGEFATVDDVVAAVSGKADTSAIPSLDGYATQEWVGEQGYLTEVPESAVSGFATHEEVDEATSGKADTSATVPVVDSFRSFLSSTDYVGAVADRSGNFYQIVARSGDPQSAWVVTYEKDGIQRNVYYGKTTAPWPSGGWSISPTWIEFPEIGYVSDYGLYLNGGAEISPSSRFTVNGVVSATSAGITADNSLTATNYGITASGLTAGAGASFGIKCAPEVFSGGSQTGFTFSSQNTGFGTAQLTTAYSNQIVQMTSPKFEARNVSGAGFSIEASAAKGYDHNGNVIWDTSNPPAPNRLISFAATQPAILISPTPSSYSANAPYLTANYQELAIKYSNGPSAIMNLEGFSIKSGDNQALVGNQGISVSGTDVNVYVPETSATYSLKNSIQKSMIECDSATSAITAIAGSAVGGGSTYSAGANIDITDDVISGKDWSEDIASATSGFMQTSGLEYDGDKISGYMGSAFKAGDELPEYVTDAADLVSANSASWNEVSAMQPSGDYYSASNPSGFLTDLPASATEAIDTVTANSGTWGGSALPISAGPGIKVNLVDNTLVFSNDETVLWSGTGTSGTTITLSEPLENFEKVGIFWEPFAAFGRDAGFEITPSYNDNIVNSYKRYSMFQQVVSTGHNSYLNCSLTVSSDGTSFGQYLYGYTNGSPSNFWTDHADWTIYKVVGINRVSGGN